MPMDESFNTMLLASSFSSLIGVWGWGYRAAEPEAAPFEPGASINSLQNVCLHWLHVVKEKWLTLRKTEKTVKNGLIFSPLSVFSSLEGRVFFKKLGHEALTAVITQRDSWRKHSPEYMVRLEFVRWCIICACELLLDRLLLSSSAQDRTRTSYC